MRNLIIFLSTFTLTVLLVIFTSAPANALTIPAVGGECLAGWTLNSSGSCTSNSSSGGSSGGNSGGGGAGGSWDAPDCAVSNQSWIVNGTRYKKYQDAGQAFCIANGADIFSGYSGDVNYGSSLYVSCQTYGVGGDTASGTIFRLCDDVDIPKPPPKPPEPTTPPPEPPPPPPPTPDCNVCEQLYQIKLKIYDLQNLNIHNFYDLSADIYSLSYMVTNIDNSINDLSVNVDNVNNNLTNIDNSIGNLITNIENNNITQNEIKNEINNINNVMNDYSLQLGDIKMAMGDIDVKLDNTNKLVLDLRPDIEFIKNNLVNGSPEGKDYTEQLNQIIELLKPCEPTAEIPCPDDDEVVKKLKEIQDYMEADFVPGTDSTAVEVEDLTDIELDRSLINFGVAQCPPDNEFSTMVNGFSFSGGFKHKPLCDFFTMLSPFIKAFGGFSAALILGGGLRRG